MAHEDSSGAIAQNRGHLLVVLASLAVVSMLHYGTPRDPDFHVLHNLWRRLYYIPIIIGAFRFGLRGCPSRFF